jgi:hypothetical protein
MADASTFSIELGHNISFEAGMHSPYPDIPAWGGVSLSFDVSRPSPKLGQHDEVFAAWAKQ